MKFNVTMEATDAELRDLAADVARRGVMYLVGELGSSMGASMDRIFSPEVTQSILMNIGPILQQVQKAQMRRRSAPMPMDGSGPPPGYGYPPRHPFGTPPPVPNVVVPFPASGAVMEKCIAIEETRQNEAAWGCHQCGSPNALNRDECRNCGHRRCGSWPVVTPPSTGPNPNPTPPSPHLEPEPA